MTESKKKVPGKQKSTNSTKSTINTNHKDSINSLHLALENPQNHVLLARHASTIQRTLGNHFLARLVNQTPQVGSSKQSIQRLQIPEDIDPLAPDTDDVNAFRQYLDGRFNAQDFRTVLKIKRFLETATSQSASAGLTYLNSLEQQNTPASQNGVQPLSPLQVNEITQLIPGDYIRAIKILDEVQNNPDVLNRTFGLGHRSEAKENIKRIQTQLKTCYQARNIKPDEEGKLTSTGTNAHNIGEGATGSIVLSHEWSQAPQADRVGTLIHEASHGTPRLTTLDIAYLSGWCIGYLNGDSALNNADNYKKMALLHLHAAAPEKQLQGQASPQHLARVKRLLAVADFFLTTARVNALKIQRDLTSGRRVSSLSKIIQRLMWTIKAPCCSEVASLDKLPSARYAFITDPDIIKVTLFCQKFGQVVARLNAITHLQTPPDGDMSIPLPNLIIPLTTLSNRDDPIAAMIIFALWSGQTEADWDRMELTKFIFALANSSIGDRGKILTDVQADVTKPRDNE